MAFDHIMPSSHAVPRSSALARLANVVIDPRASFRDVASDPRWLVAFLGVILLRFASLFVFYQPSTTPEKLVVGLLFQVVSTAPLLLALALVLWNASRACDVRVTWPVAFDITVHVYFAYTVATVAIASVAGAVLPASADVDLRNPPFTSLGALAPADGVVRTLLAHVDVRLAYALVLVSLGLRAGVPGVRVGQVALAAVSGYGVLLAFTLISVAWR